MISTTPIRATSALDFPLSSLAGLKSLTWYYVNDNELGGFRADLLAEIVAPLQATQAQAKKGKTPVSNLAASLFANTIQPMPIVTIGAQTATLAQPRGYKTKHVRLATLAHIKYLIDNPPVDADPAVLRSLRLLTSDFIRAAFAPVESAVKKALAPSPKPPISASPAPAEQRVLFLQVPPIRLSKMITANADLSVAPEQVAPAEQPAPTEPRTTYQITRRYLREEDDPALYKIFADLLYRAADSAAMQPGVDYQTRQTKNGVAVRLFDEEKAKQLVRTVYRLAKKVQAAIEAKEISQ
jgi:hypothetical protein